MNKRKYWIIRVFFVLFTLSVSVTVLPCGLVNTYGLFGEITASTIVEDKDQVIGISSQYYGKVQKTKGINIINIWFELFVLVICIRFIVYIIKLPREDTIVTLKVRMDN